ncbi:MAG: hypothetical protein H6526_00515 [Actinobacteria bacterium]|nr:hypothetical protein [Actinomycetota bacterium]MCB8998093.1 hypothetical protein [Actinomycetota bacterium]MCB9413745.1 hypothetical protein [Actinomycetota bacterium]MCB9424771.1 hypothetical protein [Actinomycetota bacterium]HRY10148.1 hypothetical protein [Candidatus Nanopelagicales bacterium]
MNTTPRKHVRTVAASTAVLVGSGLMAATAPAQAAVAAEPAGAIGVTQAGVQEFTRTSAQGPLIVHRTGTVAARASIAAAPKVVQAKKRKKSKKKYRSRRS